MSDSGDNVVNLKPGGAAGQGEVKPRVRLTGGERREQILGVARSIFAERGYEATTVEEIADRAKISKPVVYEHFGGKEGIYAVIIDREVRSLIDRIALALSASHPRAALEQAAGAFLGYIEEEQDGFRILVRDAPPGGARGSLSNVMSDIAIHVEGLLAREFKARGYDRKIAPLTARALVGMIAFTGEWWLETGRPKRKTVAAHVVNLAWNGLRHLEKDPERSAP